MINENLPPLPLTEGRLLIDNSFLESFTTCPRKAQYARLMQRHPKHEHAALTFGTAIHHALEWRYKNCKNNSVDILSEEDQIQQSLIPFFEKNVQPEDDHRSLQFAIELIRHYNRRYVVEPFQLLTNPDGSVMTELSFCLPLYEHVQPNGVVIPVYYIGRIDLPVLWDDQIIIVDHKTASMLGTYYFDGQKVSPQYEGYCWAFEQLSGKHVSGFCINALRTKEPPAKPRTSWDTWWDEGLQRHKEYLRPGQLTEWKSNTIMLIKEFFYHYSADYMPMKKKACTMYGKCAYFDVCYLPEENRKVVLQSDSFETNDWSPLK